MTCKHCGKPIELATSLVPKVKYRHTETQMITCFDDHGPMRVGDEYLRAEPKDS